MEQWKYEELKCGSCHKTFLYNKETDVQFDDHGYGYSTKLVKCKCCGKFNIVRYYQDRAMKLNNDSRFYNYRRNK